jgi:hypothetical protein
MQHILLSTPLPDGREVCVAPVSADAFEANCAYSLGDDTGYFIYEFDNRQPGTGIEILAKAASYEAAMRLIDIFVSVQRPSPITLTDAPPRSPPAPPLGASLSVRYAAPR